MKLMYLKAFQVIFNTHYFLNFFFYNRSAFFQAATVFRGQVPKGGFYLVDGVEQRSVL